MSDDTWYILGAGSLGQLWGALLHRAGRPVCLLVRDAARLDDYARAGGVTLHEGKRVERLAVRGAVADAAVPATKLIVATKAHQTMTALAPFLARRDDELTIAILQNGMGAAEEAQAAFPRARIYPLVTTTSAWREAPFDVHRAGIGRTIVGRHGATGSEIGQDVTDVARSLTAPGLELEPTADIRPPLWRKLSVNCVINPLAALLGIRNGEVPRDPRALAVMDALCTEIAAVATAEGIAVTAAEVLAAVEATCRATADNYNSMLQDLRRRRVTEIDYINGYLLARAAEHGLSCPANAQLYEEVRRRSGAQT
jgi:2-dehydropantoate 2-reductase